MMTISTLRFSAGTFEKNTGAHPQVFKHTLGLIPTTPWGIRKLEDQFTAQLPDGVSVTLSEKISRGYWGVHGGSYGNLSCEAKIGDREIFTTSITTQNDPDCDKKSQYRLKDYRTMLNQVLEEVRKKVSS